MADEPEKSFHSAQPETEISTDNTPTELEPSMIPSPKVSQPTPPPDDMSPSMPVSTETAPSKNFSNKESTLLTTEPTKTFNEQEILSEQFENYLRISLALLKTLKRPKDIEICSNLLRNVQRLNDSKRPDVKRNNNIFFRYFLKVLKWTSDNQPLELYRYWYRNMNNAETTIESSTWLEDNKSYMASKRLEDGTTIIYTAIAHDPSAGWENGGLNILAKRGASTRKY